MFAKSSVPHSKHGIILSPHFHHMHHNPYKFNFFARYNCKTCFNPNFCYLIFDLYFTCCKYMIMVKPQYSTP
jgi:hypothetical protein